MKTVTKLKASQSFLVSEAVRDKYVSSGLGDRGFAEKISIELGFPVSESSIATSRKIFNLPARKFTLPQNKNKLSALEARISAIELRLSTYFGDKA